VPGRIHKEEFFDFWKDTLKASPWVLSTLQLGYKIPFLSIPPIYEERNNATAREKPEIVRQIVEEMVDLKIVKLVKEKPRCVSPLGLVTKVKEDGTEKHRLIFDASRCVNNHLEKLKVTLSHLEKALEVTEETELQTIFDLASCYYHVKIFEPQQTFLGAAFESKNGTKKYFVYQHLPFGLASAVHAITKIFKPILAYVHEKGIKLSLYIDDGRFLSKNLAEANSHRELIYDVLNQAGWQISKEKSDGPGEAACIKEYLGFTIDTQKMQVSISESKILKLEKSILEAVNLKFLHIKHLSKIQGKIISLIPSHGFVARVATKSGYCLIENHTKEFGWSGMASLDQSTIDEWNFFVGNIRVANGTPIRSNLNDIKISTILENPVTNQKLVPHVRSMNEKVMISDASSFKVVAYDLNNSDKSELDVAFSAEEKTLSSGLRELLAVRKTINKWLMDKTVTDKHVYWCTDSSNVVAFLSKGSGRPHVQKFIFDIAKKLQSLRVIISPIHLLRSDERIQLADERSKVCDSDDWSIDFLSFEHLQKQFSFEVDVFASKANARLPKFYSADWEENTAGIDAFAQDWSKGMLWLSPPVKLLIRCAKRIRQTKCQGLIILPRWPTALFYCYFFEGLKVRPPFIFIKLFKPFIYQNQGAESALKGKIDFDFIALYFKI